MTIDELKSYLASCNSTYDEKDIQHGTQLRCHTGEVFTVYNTGKVVPGGTQTQLTANVVELQKTKSAIPAKPKPVVLKSDVSDTAKGRDVFIVYGRDTDARDQLELILRRMGMNPVILSQLPAAGDKLIEKLESYVGQKGNVAYACVLVTPDDEGHLAGAMDQKSTVLGKTSSWSLAWCWPVSDESESPS